MKKFVVITVIVMLLLSCLFVLNACKQDENDILYIYVSKSPDKIVYYAGESLDMTGCELTVKTKNNKDYTVAVTNKMVSGFSSALGNHTLTITYVYGDSTFIATQSITVATRKATSAVITSQPNNTTFINGQNIDLTGFVAEVTFSDKTVQERYAQAFVFNKSVAELGMEEVELKLDSVVLKIPITVLPKVISGLKVTTNPSKLIYQEGDVFDPSGMVVYTVFNDGTLNNVIEYEVVNGEMPLTANQTYVQIRERNSVDFEVNVPIVVTASDIQDIELNIDTIRQYYIAGAHPDFSTITANITFNDGTVKFVDYSNLVFSLDESTTLSEGDHTITVRYKFATNSEKSQSFVIHVSNQRLPMAIKVTTHDDFYKDYMDGEQINFLGLSVFVVYNDSSEVWAINLNEINLELDDFSYTQFADSQNPFIEFKCGNVSAKVEIDVKVQEPNPPDEQIPEPEEQEEE